MQGTVIVTGEAIASASSVSTTESQAESTAEQAAPAADAAVSIVDFSFEPATLDVPPGTSVVWTNDGRAPHTVSGDFADSGLLEPGQTFSYTFSESGEFGYHCSVHPNMTGTIRVSALAAAESTPTASSAADGATLEGVWLIQLTPDDNANLGRHRALATFHDDGTVEADISAESGDDATTAVLASGRGEWLLQGALCRVSLIALMNDADQRFAGTAIFEAESQLDTTGRAMDGAFNFALVDADGQSLGDGNGTFRCESVPLDA
jgi:plastocyanin